jgi:V-type H+-transporting ATPase subunit a
MSFGVCLKACNALHRQNFLDLWGEFLPQIILLLGLFGYMDLIIIVKWCTEYTDPGDAPSVISFMISIMLNQGEIDGQPFIGSRGFN